MVKWFKRLLGGNGPGDSAPPGDTEHLGPAWEAEQRARREQEAADTNYGRLEISFEAMRHEDSDVHEEIGEHERPARTRENRRNSDDRRNGPRDRRVRDIPIKKDRRASAWDRRKQYGERRFNRERRDTSSVPQQQPVPSVNPPVREPLVPSAPDKAPHLPPPEVTQGKMPFTDGTGAVIACLDTTQPAGCYALEIMGSETVEVMLRLDKESSVASLIAGTATHELPIPSVLVEKEQIILTARGSFTLAIGNKSRGEILLGAEKRSLNLADVLQKKMPVTTLLLSDIGNDMEMLAPQHFRFGQVRLHFDLTQVVEIRTATGDALRISGPLGSRNFTAYKDTLG